MSVIILSGVIGAGKSTATELISNYFGTTPFYEPVDDNPLLEPYYADPAHNAILLQIYFLNKRFAMIKEALKQNNNVLDRSIYEDRIFAIRNNLDGNITDVEMDLYDDLYQNMLGEIDALAKDRPDLLVHLDISLEHQIEHIQGRGRKYEQLDFESEGGRELLEYYKRLHDDYDAWFDSYDTSAKVKISLDDLDITKPEDADEFLYIVEDKLREIGAL